DELVASPLHQLGDAVQDLAAVVRRLRRPAGLGLARGTHRVADVLAGPAAGVGQQLPLRAVDLVRPAGLRAREGAADVELVRLAHADPVAPPIGRAGAGQRL